jgi:hypothetical protein
MFNSVAPLNSIAPLNSVYFKTIYHTSSDKYDYYVVKPKNNPIILFSGLFPIAAITFREQTSHLSPAKTTFMKRESNEIDFQGIITENNREYELVLTNLTSLGEIKIDISKENTSHQEVDPGPKKRRINRVNEIHPFQSYPVRGDQKDSRSFILSTISESIDVLYVESLGQRIGTYYYISVVPRKDCPELIKKFENTHWDCVDFFCMKVPKKFIAPRHKKRSGQSTRPVLFASQTTSGRWVNTRGVVSHIEYEYNVPTNLDEKLCSVCLAVCHDMILSEEIPPNELYDAAKLAINDLLLSTKNDEQLLSIPTIYESNECVICLDSEQPIDTVFFTCGHKCCHATCCKEMKQCPVCLAEIISIIQI